MLTANRTFRFIFAFFTLFITYSVASQAQSGSIYYPTRYQWEERSPEQVGLDASQIKKAIQFAIDHESSNPKDLELHLNSRTNEPYNELIGPVKERGPATGLIIKNGYIAGQWGDPQRVDMTFSVTKSFLSTTVGVAWDRDLIKSIDDKVQKYMPLKHFNSAHNTKITWDHLLRQTSDWEGTLFGKPDWADRPADKVTTDVINRQRNEPGTKWKYNDVRVNVLALAALNVWRKPLPMVLREYIMDPIGASNTWRWHGYENSWVNIDGVKMQSVSGGGHWGGGMWISAYDQARFGYLTLRDGNWSGKQLISKEWLRKAKTPTEANTSYGFMNFFLNTDKEWLSNAPETAFFHLGAGINMVYVDQEHHLVIVARWLSDYEAMNELVGLVLDAVE